MRQVTLLPDPRPSQVVKQDDVLSAIERQAQNIARRYFDRPMGEAERDDVAAGVELEIMLVLAHLDRIKQGQAKSLFRLLELEAQTNTKRMKLRPWGDLSGSENTPTYFRLDDRLFKLELERQRLLATLDDRLRPHHDRLHQLLIRHAVLDI